MRVVVDQSSLRRLAILRLPGLPASRDFPDDRRWPRTRFLGFVRGAQICMAPGERDMIAASSDWLSSVLNIVSQCLPLRAVQCQPYTLRHGLRSPRFLSPYLLDRPGHFSPSGLGWHILRKLPWEILHPLATSKFEPQTWTTHHLYCKSLQYLRDGYILVYTLCTIFTGSEPTPQALILGS